MIYLYLDSYCLLSLNEQIRQHDLFLFLICLYKNLIELKIHGLTNIGSNNGV